MLTWQISCFSPSLSSSSPSLSLLFQSIIIGVVGFWGGVFVMGSVYLLMVLAKRVFKPEEADKSPAWSSDNVILMSALLYPDTIIYTSSTFELDYNNMFMRIIVIFRSSLTLYLLCLLRLWQLNIYNLLWPYIVRELTPDVTTTCERDQIRDSERISKLPQIQLILPYKSVVLELVWRSRYYPWIRYLGDHGMEKWSQWSDAGYQESQTHNRYIWIRVRQRKGVTDIWHTGSKLNIVVS